MTMYGSGSPADTLHDTIAGKLATAQLSREWPVTNRGALGSGGTCGACDRVIEPHQVELHASFRDGATQIFHARCFITWWDLVLANGGGRRGT